MPMPDEAHFAHSQVAHLAAPLPLLLNVFSINQVALGVYKRVTKSSARHLENLITHCVRNEPIQLLLGMHAN